MDPSILDLVKITLASGGVATLGLNLRFLVRFVHKHLTRKTIIRLTEGRNPKELQALIPVLDALVRNGSLPTLRGEELLVPPTNSKTEQP